MENRLKLLAKLSYSTTF